MRRRWRGARAGRFYGKASVIAGAGRTIGTKCSPTPQRVFEEEGLPIFAMTQAKPFQNRYSLLDAQCFDEFPTWKAAMFSPVPVRKQMFADAELRKKLRAEAIEDQSPSVFPKRWDVIIVDHVKLEHNKSLQGKSVQDIAEAQKQGWAGLFSRSIARRRS